MEEHKKFCMKTILKSESAYRSVLLVTKSSASVTDQCCCQKSSHLVSVYAFSFYAFDPKYVHVCGVCVSGHVCVCACVCVYQCACVHVRVHMHVCACMRACVCMHVRACMRSCVACTESRNMCI